MSNSPDIITPATQIGDVEAADLPPDQSGELPGSAAADFMPDVQGGENEELVPDMTAPSDRGRPAELLQPEDPATNGPDMAAAVAMDEAVEIEFAAPDIGEETAAGGGGEPPIDKTPPGGTAEGPGDGDGDGSEGDSSEGELPAPFPHGGVRRTLHDVARDLQSKGVDARELLGEEDQRLYDALTDPTKTTAELREDMGVSATKLHRSARSLVQHVLDATSENLGVGAPEREMLGSLQEGLASMGVDLAEVLPDRALQRTVELLSDRETTYVDVGDQLGVDLKTVRDMVSSVIRLISEKAPAIIDRTLGVDPEMMLHAHVAPRPATTERWGRGEVPLALDKIKDLLANKGHELADFLPAKAAGLRAAAPLFAEGLSDAEIASRLDVSSSHVSNMRTRLVDTLVKHVPANVIAPQLMPEPRRVLSETGHVGTQVGDLIREAGLTPTQLARELGIAQPRMSRFLSGATQPLAEEVLLPVLRRLNAPPEVVERLLEAYGSGRARGPGWAGRRADS